MARATFSSSSGGLPRDYDLRGYPVLSMSTVRKDPASNHPSHTLCEAHGVMENDGVGLQELGGLVNARNQSRLLTDTFTRRVHGRNTESRHDIVKLDTSETYCRKEILCA